MADDPKQNIESLFEKQAALQESYDHEKGKFQSARTKFAKKKQALLDFNAKYGRMLKLVVVEAEKAEHLAEVEDEAKAQAKAQAKEVVLTKPDDVVPVEEIVNDPPVDTSAEE